MPTITEKYEEEVRKQKEDAEAIRTATDYSSQLKHGDSYDSSERAYHRMKYVRKAEDQLEEKYKKEILELASKLCLEDI